MLALRPDGSLLQAKQSALDGTPFGDWRVPGVLLAVLVGGGLVSSAVWVWRDWPWAKRVAIASALGLIVFEVVEFLLLGFQGLQVVILVLGLALLWLSAGLPWAEGAGAVRRSSVRGWTSRAS